MGNDLQTIRANAKWFAPWDPSGVHMPDITERSGLMSLNLEDEVIELLLFAEPFLSYHRRPYMACSGLDDGFVCHLTRGRDSTIPGPPNWVAVFIVLLVWPSIKSPSLVPLIYCSASCLNKLSNSFIVSLAIAFPSRAALASWRFWSCKAKIRCSTVASTVKRYTTTSTVWLSRWTRSMACSSTNWSSQWEGSNVDLDTYWIPEWFHDNHSTRSCQVQS